jgi:hypothetical protein
MMAVRMYRCYMNMGIDRHKTSKENDEKAPLLD